VTDHPFPTDYAGFRLVTAFEELASTPLAQGLHALCWPRRLAGDFGEVVRCFADREGITSLDEELLRSLPLSAAGKAAVEVLVADLANLRGLGLEPELNVINGYLREEDPGPVPRDVMGWHVDSATEETDTWLCTYYGPSSEALRHADAVPCAEVPALRAALLSLYGGGDDAGFAEFLEENCYDLRYVARAGAEPYVFGQGNLWRVAAQYPDSPVPPCVHRAPDAGPGELRLLLIS
jgi:hypothetical protein